MKRFILSIGFILFLAGILAGQTVDLQFLKFDYNNDLSSGYVTAVEQDTLGFMWFGTTNGLNRFDGYEMKKYLADDGLNYGINESFIYQLYTDKKGSLWISLNSKICRYIIQNDSIEVIADNNYTNGLSNVHIIDYAENSDSILYISNNKTIYRFNEEKRQFIPVFTVDKGDISSFCFDIDGNIWISCINDGGISYFNTKSKEFNTIDLPKELSSTNSVWDVLIYHERLWLATDGEGVISYDLKHKSFKRYQPDSEYAAYTRKLYVDKDDFLWSMDLTGIKLYVQDRDFFQGYYSDLENDYSIPQYLNGFYQDKQRNYWSVHNPGGVGFAPRPKGIIRFDSKVNSPFRLNVDHISAIAEDSNGNLFMGNPFSGIDVFYWVRGKTVRYLNNSNDHNSLGRGAVHDIFRDSNARIWVGTYWGGLQLFDGEKEVFYDYRNDPNNLNSIASNDIRAITEDKEGNIWVCAYGKGVDCFNVATDSVIHFNVEQNNLANNYVVDIVCDVENNIWIATSFGVSVLKAQESVFKNYSYEEQNSNSLSSDMVYTIFEDRLNRIWIGTPKGLNLYQPEEDNFKQITTGFTNKNIVSIIDDDENNIWMGTFYGISRYNPQTGTVLNLSTDDGLISNDFLPRAVFNNGKNTLFFGSLNGLNYFDPSEINYNNLPPEVYVTKFKLYNNEITLHNNKTIDENIILEKKLKVDYNQNIIGFEFAAINYAGADKNSYAYYLEGFETDWNYVGNNHEVTYTNLKPGKYYFKVKAANNEGVWNNQGASLLLEITPPFWDFAWFKVLVILIVLVTILFIINLREKNLVRDKQKLEQKVRERTAEIIEQKDELEKQKIELEKANSLNKRFFNILAHDLRSPIASIVQLVSLLKDRMEDDPSFSNAEIINLIDKTAGNTSNLLEDLLLWGRSRTNSIQLNFEKLKLCAIVNQAIEGFYPYLLQKRITIKNNDISNDIEVVADTNCLKVVFRNLISNAIKFSYKDSEIIIDCFVRNAELIISVKDNGIGMPVDKIRKFSKKEILSSTAGTFGEKGSGLGLSLSKELIEQNNGQLWIESQLQKGVKVYISLPLAQ